MFDSLQAIWELSGRKSEAGSSKHAITGLRLKLKDAETSRRRYEDDRFKIYRIIPHKRTGNNLSPTIITQIAAVLIVLVSTLYVVNYVKKMASEIKNRTVKPTARFEEVFTKTGQQATLRFSDGTQVLLNSASRLRYADYPDGSRQFYLNGEAYFEVVHSDFRPLIVRTAHAVIRDVGTKFDVKSWRDDGQTQVTVAEGEVIVHPDNRPQNDTAIVVHGQFTTVKDDGTLLPPRYTNVYQTIAWIDGKLVFKNEPMRSVLKQLNRRYGLICFIEDTSLLSKTITATFEKGESPKEILDIIALSLNLSYRTSNDSVLFVPTKSNSM